jgi:hypothetical protein
VRLLQRRLAEQLPEARATGDGTAPLEHASAPADAPRCTPAQMVEGHALRAVRVDGEPVPAIAAFLDGTQRTRVAAYLRGLPIVMGTVAAVVRVRHLRRLTTWPKGPLVGRLLCAPRAQLSADEWGALETLGIELRDCSSDDRGAPVAAHPFALLERARGLVEYEREAAEQELAHRWCATENGTLLVDGGISGSERIASSACTIGVVKSHRTLHVDAADVPALLALRHRQRTTVFRVAPARRAPVLSWYLRLRDPEGRDPFWGLIRVEVAEEPRFRTRSELVTERADEVSRWLLAETAPLALPDARWDKMVYGIRDCEEFLRAVC